MRWSSTDSEGDFNHERHEIPEKRFRAFVRFVFFVVKFSIQLFYFGMNTKKY
jgi:hypothetical protein